MYMRAKYNGKHSDRKRMDDLNLYIMSLEVRIIRMQVRTHPWTYRCG